MILTETLYFGGAAPHLDRPSTKFAAETFVFHVCMFLSGEWVSHFLRLMETCVIIFEYDCTPFVEHVDKRNTSWAEHSGREFLSTEQSRFSRMDSGVLEIMVLFVTRRSLRSCSYTWLTRLTIQEACSKKAFTLSQRSNFSSVSLVWVETDSTHVLSDGSIKIA